MNEDNFLKNSISKDEHELLTPNSKMIVEVQVGEPIAPALLPLSAPSTLVEVANNSSTSPTFPSLTPYANLARS